MPEALFSFKMRELDLESMRRATGIGESRSTDMDLQTGEDIIEFSERDN